MVYQVEDQSELDLHLDVVNALLAEQGKRPLAFADLDPGPNQLKCLIDLCRLNGIAAVFDLVFNHADGGFDDRSLYFQDRQPGPDRNRSLYFTDKGWAGGLVFAYWQAPVCRYLIAHACFFLGEFRIDGIRYDEVTVMHEHGGDAFCRDLSGAVRAAQPEAIQIAEFWGHDRAHAVRPAPAGPGFDAALGCVAGWPRRPAGPERRCISIISGTRSSLRPASQPLGGQCSASRTTTSCSGTTASTVPAGRGWQGSPTRPTRAPDTPGAARGSRRRCC